MRLPTRLYTAEQTRTLDQRAIAHGIPGYQLMSRAGTAAYRVLRLRWPGASRAGVVCGTGNNGGDGFVIARLLREAGVQTELFLHGEAQRIRGDAATARTAWEDAGGRTLSADSASLDDCDLLVDALFGTGLHRDLLGATAALVDRINASPARKLAVDIPSGIASDTGAVMGVAVRADLTVTFIGLKRGLFTADGPEHAGCVAFADLGVPPEVFTGVDDYVERVAQCPQLAQTARARWLGAHKGTFGHVLVLGGDYGMSGAVRLAGLAALRAGAGLVSVATRAAHAAAGPPELMLHGVESAEQLAPLLQRASSIAVGPGLGQSAWAVELLAAALDCNKPLVIDADALNLLAAERRPCQAAVLTPHPGEAARLLGCRAREIQRDRFSAVRNLLARYDAGAVVLKGNGTLVADASRIALLDRGTPALATGGSGDVLTGTVAAFLARGTGLMQAALCGACVHAVAGERVAAGRLRGVTAGDVADTIAQCLPDG
ncbi:MAG: NAD(P)H-hydrate dehydratase [Gammaproteobacteria bacterium]|nr:NAD(P)H-hydrate dehydratase [Gammaproteobacteria bacterium]